MLILFLILVRCCVYDINFNFKFIWNFKLIFRGMTWQQPCTSNYNLQPNQKHAFIVYRKRHFLQPKSIQLSQNGVLVVKWIRSFFCHFILTKIDLICFRNASFNWFRCNFGVKWPVVCFGGNKSMTGVCVLEGGALDGSYIEKDVTHIRRQSSVFW